MLRGKKVRRARGRKPAASKKGATSNRNAQWRAYRQLQTQADQAWKRFRDHVKKGAKAEVLIRDNNHMLLLLGECNYMARECMRLISQRRRKSR